MTGRVRVTGGAGFIGSHLVDELVRSGHDVDVIDNLEPQVHKRKPDYLNPKARYHYKDIREDGVLVPLLRDADAVVHLAAMVGVGREERGAPKNELFADFKRVPPGQIMEELDHLVRLDALFL